MIRTIILTLVMAAVATSGFAGFKMFGPNGQMNSTETEGERAARLEREAEMEQEFLKRLRNKDVNARYEAKKTDSVDMSGVEWRQTRGAYSGRGDQITKPFGYRAGKYKLEFNYRGGTNFIVWMHTRRGQRELLVNIIDGLKGFNCVRLKKDDEVWFEVDTGGNWSMTFEQKP